MELRIVGEFCKINWIRNTKITKQGEFSINFKLKRAAQIFRALKKFILPNNVSCVDFCIITSLRKLFCAFCVCFCWQIVTLKWSFGNRKLFKTLEELELNLVLLCFYFPFTLLSYQQVRSGGKYCKQKILDSQSEKITFADTPEVVRRRKNEQFDQCSPFPPPPPLEQSPRRPKSAMDTRFRSKDEFSR